MLTPDKNNQNINRNEDDVSAENTDANESSMPADDGFKTGKKSHGLTWEEPMDEQAFDRDSQRMDQEDEEAD